MITGEGGIGILGMGKYLPKRVIDNSQIASWTGISAQEIEQKIGVKTRCLGEDSDKGSDYALQASKQAMERAGVSAESLRFIVSCSFTNDYHFPAMSCKIQAELKAWNAGAFDILANCTSFQVGLATAVEKMAFDSSIDTSLVVATALQSRYIDWHDPETAMYFGDGAGATVLGRVPAGYGFLSNAIMTNGRVYDAVRRQGDGTAADFSDERRKYIEMNGMEVWKQVIQWQPRVIRRALEKAGLTEQDVDFFIFHQANLNLVKYLIGKMRLPMDKTYTTVEKYGNTADASLAITLCEAVEQEKIKRDDIVVVSGVGAGFIFGASVMKWY